MSEGTIPEVDVDSIDLSDLDWWLRPLPEREAAFAALRAERPIAPGVLEALPHLGLPESPYWSVTRYADIVEASRHPELFCSGQGTNIADLPPDFLEFFGSMINLDDPRHARMRRIVSRGFTPRQLETMKADVEGVAAGIVDEMIERGECDFVTELVTSEVDGEHLSPQELASFFILLVVAGNETTRNAIAHGLWTLTEHPEQKARWLADIDGMTPGAVEEIVRWASPVIHFRRTVTTDGARLGDHEFSEGERVVLWYWSGNRDEAVFDQPHRFDIGRSPNDHIGFGGPGPHFCLGAHLARREISVMFRELLRRMPDIHSVGEPERLRSGFINGIKHLHVEWAPVRPAQSA